MPLAEEIKDIKKTYGESLLSVAFLEKFYSIFFTLSKESESRFQDVEKQKKALHGMLLALATMSEDKDIYEEIGKLKQKHDQMKITPGEVFL